MKKFTLFSAIFIVVSLLIIAVGAPFFTPQSANSVDLSMRFAPSGEVFWLGTDHLGRSELARLSLAIGVSLGSAFATLALILILGVSAGGLAGFAGGRTDQILMRVCDVFFSVPTVILALFLVGIFGAGLFNIVTAIALSHWAWYARMVRSVVFSLKNNEYVMISVTSGASFLGNFKRNMLKPILSQCLVLATLDVGHIVLHICGLSFLGLGVKAPTPELGVMINDAKEYVFSRPEFAIYPGIVIFLCVASFNVIGEHLRDKLGDSRYL